MNRRSTSAGVVSVWATVRRFVFPRASIALLAVAILAIIPSAADAASTLTWDESGSNPTAEVDGLGVWATAGSFWSNGTTDGAWVSGDNATIGNDKGSTTSPLPPLPQVGTPLPSTASLITMGSGGVTVGNITFGHTTNTNYYIEDTTAGSDPLLLANTTTTITCDPGGVTSLSANLVVPSTGSYTINLTNGTTTSAVDFGIGGSIGVTSGANGNTGAPALNVTMSASGTAGQLWLSGVNNLSSTKITSGTVDTTNNGALGPSTAPVTLAGGTLQLIQGSIGMHVASFSAAGTWNQLTSGNSAGVYSTGQWNNIDINHSASPPITSGATSDTVLPTMLTDNLGVVTTASVSSWTGSNGYGNTNGTTGIGQLFGSWLNANTANTNPATITISNIPYSNYSVYVYFYNNGSGAKGSMAILTSPTTYYFSTGGSSAPTAYTPDTSTVNGTYTTSNYAVWTGQSGSTLTVTDTEASSSSGTTGIAGIQIVAAPISIGNAVSVTSSSTLEIGAYEATATLGGGTPTLTGGLTIGPTASLTLTVAENNTGSELFVNSQTTLSGTGEILSPNTGVTVQLAGITDGGHGFKTAGAGTVILTADSSGGPGSTGTATGAVSLGTTTVDLSMASSSSGSATGAGALTIASGCTLTVPTSTGFTKNGIVSPSSTTVSSGGTITGPASGGTLDVNSSLSDSGNVTGGAGTLQIGGATTVNNGGKITTGAGSFTIGGTTTVSSGGTIATTGAGNLAISSGLTFSSGAVFDVSLPQAAGVGTPQIGVGGLLSLNQNLTINVTQASGFGANIIYPLINFTSLTDNSERQTGWTITAGPTGSTTTIGFDLNRNLDLEYVVRTQNTLTSYNGASGTPGTVFGTPVNWLVPPSSSYAGFEAQSPGQTTGGSAAANGYGPLLATDGFGNNLNATILAGTNSGNYMGNGSALMQMSWRNRTLQETTAQESGSPTSPPLPGSAAALISNVLHLVGMGTGGEPVQTDPFALQMNYNAALLSDEAAQAAEGTIYLAWLNPNGAGAGVPLWENATAGNFGPAGSDVGTLGMGYQGSFAAFVTDEETLNPLDFPGNPAAANLTGAELDLLLGSYGVDISNHDVWAVVNHNSDFAVVPEPSSIALAAIGLLGGLLAIRRRSPRPVR